MAIAGPAIGPTLGGYIVTNLDWRWIFFINLPIGIVADHDGAHVSCPRTASARLRARVDWLSIALLATGLGSLQTLLEEGYSHDWWDSGLVQQLAPSRPWCRWCWFVRRQLESESPVVDLCVLRYRSLLAGCLLSAVIGMGLYGALFAIPIFAQTVLHCTSQQTGMLLLPGALASAFTMPIAARLLRHFDPRVLITAGARIVIASMLWLSNLNPQTGESDLFWPLIVRGFGTVLMFLPMSMATLGSVPVAEISESDGPLQPHATTWRQYRHCGAHHGARLAPRPFTGTSWSRNLSATDPDVLGRVQALTGAFASKGFDLEHARRQALLLLDQTVNVQASVLSFADTFWIVAMLFLGALPLVLLLGKGKPRAPAAGAH